MSFLFDTLLHFGRNGEIDPTQLEDGFAALSATRCAPTWLLARYARSSDAMNLEDPHEDLDTHQLIFHYGVLSALRGEENFAWLETFADFTSDADRLFKAVALFRLAAFFGFGELYLRGDTRLEKTLWDGSFADPWFRHVYLYEFLAGEITPHQLHPWAHIRHHGRNLVDMFGTEERIRQVRKGRVARLFAQGLLRRLEAVASNPELAPCYQAFFAAYLTSHNAHRGGPLQWAHGHEAWDPDTLKTRLLAGLLNEQFDHPILTRILQEAIR